MCTVPEDRVARLCEIYKPKKVTMASIDLVDTAGLSRTHEGSAARLAMIREVGCLVIVVAAYDGSEPIADLVSLNDDLLLADLEIVAGRVSRLRESVKKPRPNRDQELAELEALEPLHQKLESGDALRDLDLSPEQEKAIKSFQLFSQKPRLAIINVAEDEENSQQLCRKVPDQVPTEAVSLSMQLELSRIGEFEREQFCEEMGVSVFNRDDLIRRIMDVSGQMLFFTAGEKEVRTWMIRKEGTAVEAADGIHTDLARGFVRAETMSCEDLFRLGSEREVKANNLMRREHKGYVIQDGDILHILSNV